jgi:formylglycine-generating enzyme
MGFDMIAGRLYKYEFFTGGHFMKRSISVALFLAVILCLSPVFADDRSVVIKGKQSTKATSAKTFKTNYYALVIGNNEYRHLPKLSSAVNDATEVSRVLSGRYGFKAKLLLNATRKDILSTINEFRKKLNEGDSFLIYYAGHGEYDKTADKAYWLPVDAVKDDPVDWIMADDITSNVKRILAKHVIIIADSCYSGALTRSSTMDLGRKGNRDAFVAKMAQRQSRTLMASGGSEPVADAGGRGNHSIFAYALLSALKDADNTIFTAEELFHGRVKAIVAGRSDQVPQYSDIRNSGHEAGDFVFQVALAGGIEESYESASDARIYGGATVYSTGGDTYIDPTTGMDFVFVKGGCFQMGDTFVDGKRDEKPAHEACVDDFSIGKFEVTQAQWEAVMSGNPSLFKQCGGNCPVEQVSWNDIQAFIGKLNSQTGKTYRVPTEAEWEYAARSGGKDEKYSGGNDIDSVAWYDKNSGGRPHPVGRKQPNGLGIYDMSGNVWEWCSDWYGGNYYKTSPKDNPQGPSSGRGRVLRGGSWCSNAADARAALRGRYGPGSRNNRGGFRLVRTVNKM